MKNKILFFFLISLSIANADDYDIYDDSGGSKSGYVEPSKGNGETQKTQKKNRLKTSPIYQGLQTDEELSYPYMVGQVMSEYKLSSLIGNNNTLSGGRLDSFLQTNAEFGLNFNKNFFLETDWSFMPVNKRLYDTNGDKFAGLYDVGAEGVSDVYGKQDYIKREKLHYNDYGLGVNVLSINFKNSNLAAGAGKIEASFANAYSKYRFTGINGTAIAEEYSLKDKLGFYVAALFPFGKLQFNAFVNDTTGLTNTALKKIGDDNDRHGAGYNKKFENFSISFEGTFDDISYYGGFRIQAKDKKVDNNNFATERGYSFGIEKLFEFQNSIKIMPFVEIAYLDNAFAFKNKQILYFTGTLPLFFENWHILFSNSMKYDSNNGAGYINQISAGYKFDNRVVFDFGRSWEKVIYKISDGVKVEETFSAWNFSIGYLYKF
ncbi:MAG: hypothetical protein LBT02_02380 [Rickettsiales bacterium]|jgi:hypothetical protein|nr:hypothetical protein [Rickettsiales bacterium]